MLRGTRTLAVPRDSSTQTKVIVVVREIVEREFTVDEQEFRDWFDRSPSEVVDDGEWDEMVTHTDYWGRNGEPPAFLVPTGSPEGWREVYEVSHAQDAEGSRADG